MMKTVLSGVEQRTQLVGRNRLELLIFQLGTAQRFAINVFKVREVILTPKFSPVPNAATALCGLANVRGATIPLIDLAATLGLGRTENPSAGYVIVTEFNRSVQGFLVASVDRIVNMKWEDILPPPNGMDRDAYLTAITYLNEDMVQVLDVERVLVEVMGPPDSISPDIKSMEAAKPRNPRRAVVVVDDSSVARNQIKRILDELDIRCVVFSGARRALEQLKAWAGEGGLQERIAMIISDIEMPDMDGYTLTTAIRADPQLKDLYVVLHSSLSGVFNNAMVAKAGADRFVAKFSADDLAREVIARIGHAPIAPAAVAG
jgi:two-component system chemotaxis response regulator CheV